MIWIEIVIGFAVPMAWGVWQLIDLKREQRKDEARERARVEPASTDASRS